MRRVFGCLVVVAGVLHAHAAIAQEARDSLIALTEVTVLDGTGAPPRPGMTVLIRGETIARLEPSATADVPAGARVLDLPGRFVIPGLIDAHVHEADRPGAERLDHVLTALREGLHAGVTSVRHMWGDARFLAYLAREAASGRIDAPDIHYSAVFTGPAFVEAATSRIFAPGSLPKAAPWFRELTRDDDIPMLVAGAVGAGATGIKLYSEVPASLLLPIVEAAHERGLKVWAHATLFPARPSELVGAGVDVVSHAALLAWEAVDSLPPFRLPLGVPPLTSPGRLDGLDPLLEEIARRGTILDATLTVHGDSSEYPQDPETAQALASLAADVVRRAHRLGVPIAAGHDGGDPTLLHVELELSSARAG